MLLFHMNRRLRLGRGGPGCAWDLAGTLRMDALRGAQALAQGSEKLAHTCWRSAG